MEVRSALQRVADVVVVGAQQATARHQPHLPRRASNQLGRQHIVSHHDSVAPQLLEQAAGASPAMARCAAEARLELANFFMTWSEHVEPAAAASGAVERIKRLEAALAHARAPHQEEGEVEAARSSAAAGVPASIVESLAEAEERALRELIRAHTAQGNSARAASLATAAGPWMRGLVQQAHL